MPGRTVAIGEISYHYTHFHIRIRRYTGVMRHLPKLVLCDIDGTIVNTNWDMTPATRQLFMDLHDKGVWTGIASGRPVDDISFHIAKWDLPFEFDILVGLNGCEVVNHITGTSTLTHTLTGAQLRQAVDTMRQQGFEFIPFVYQGDRIVAEEISEVVRTSALKSGKTPVQGSLDEICQDNAKIMLRTKEEAETIRMEQYLAVHPIKGLKGFRTQPTLLEFAHPDISKAVPLPQIAEDLHISLEDIMACGDTSNDNEMLKTAGIGVCLANGTEDTKACADHVTKLDCDHDGLAAFFHEQYPEL